MNWTGEVQNGCYTVYVSHVTHVYSTAYIITFVSVQLPLQPSVLLERDLT